MIEPLTSEETLFSPVKKVTQLHTRQLVKKPPRLYDGGLLPSWMQGQSANMEGGE